MHEYYGKACSTYLTISQECIEENKVDEGIKYLEKGIDCNRKGEQGQPNHELAYLLNKLALAYHKKGDYEIARAFQEECLDIISKYSISYQGCTEPIAITTPKCSSTPPRLSPSSRSSSRQKTCSRLGSK